MNRTRVPRLKPLLDTVPPGFLVDTAWLKSRGIDSKSIHDYVASGWFERVIRGVYRRPLHKTASIERLPWQVVLLSLQHLNKSQVHLGGESALDIFGHVHYVRLGKEGRAHFYGETPLWLGRLPLESEVVVHRATLFNDNTLGIVDANVEGATNRWTLGVWNWPVISSTPERAILEAIDELPDNSSFENLDRIFEGLVNLRPALVMSLLESCRSVKVRRLFFVLADRHAHHWRAHLDTKRVDFGNGPRALVKGGRFHPTYGVSLPDFLLVKT